MTTVVKDATLEANKQTLLTRLGYAKRKAQELAAQLQLVNFSPVSSEEQDTPEFRQAWTDLEEAMKDLFECDLIGEDWKPWSFDWTKPEPKRGE